MTLTEFRLPDVGEGLAEAEIVQWLVEAGAVVRADQALVVVETAKAQVELPAPADGTIIELLCAPGDVVLVGAALLSYETAAGPTTPIPDRVARASSHRGLAAPSTRRLATERGIDLTGVTGTGPHGRITQADLVVMLGDSPAAATVEPADSHGDVVRPLRGLRRQVARKMTEAWSIPHVTEFREIDAAELERAYRALKSDLEQRGIRLTLMALMVRGVTVALRRHPDLNATFDSQRLEVTRHRRVDIGIAAATPDGLVVPVLRDAARHSIADLAQEIDRLARGARDRSLPIGDLTGGTTTISNFGSYGTWLGTPLINPPQVAIVGLGRVREAVVPVDGRPEVRRILPLAVAADHRLVDGEHLGAFVTTLERLFRTPLLMLGDES